MSSPVLPLERKYGAFVTVPETLTLDSSVVQAYWRRETGRIEVVERLLDLSDTGAVDLTVTRTIVHDIPHDPLAARILALPEIGVSVSGTVFRLDDSLLGGPDMLGDQEFMAFIDGLLENSTGKRDPDWRDVDHLHAHKLLGRDVFLSWDRRMLALAPDLAREYDFVLLTPEAYLAGRE